MVLSVVTWLSFVSMFTALFDQSSEWHTGMKGQLILQDDDNTTKMDGEYKKVNTLAHYKVSNFLSFAQLRLLA